MKEERQLSQPKKGGRTKKMKYSSGTGNFKEGNDRIQDNKQLTFSNIFELWIIKSAHVFFNK